MLVWVTGGKFCVDVGGVVVAGAGVVVVSGGNVVVGALTAYGLFGVVDPSPHQQ